MKPGRQIRVDPMAENVTEVLAGAAVLVVAAGFAAWAGLGNAVGPAPGSYPLTASFRSVDGISIGTDVRLAGVRSSVPRGMAARRGQRLIRW